jgi:DNA-binding response OmpR family regulator
LAKRLLLVEQNPSVLEGLAILLRWRTGLSSVCVGSLSEAERLLEAGQEFACVVVDSDLLDGGGNEVLERTNGPPTLTLVGTRGLERRARALESGGVEVPSRGGPVEETVAAVERLLGRASAHRASPASLFAPIHRTS